MDGWIKKYRKEIESQIWEHPPVYLKIWNWLLYSADYNTGELKTTLGEIAKKISWIDNRQRKTPARATISRALTLFQTMDMIELVSERPIVINITNYTSYQGKQCEKAPENSYAKPSHTRKHPDPIVSEILGHWKAVVDKDKTIGKARMYISIKYKRWKDIEIIKEAIDLFKNDCEQDPWKKENQMYRGAEWFFHFKVDEYIKRLKAKKASDPSPYREVQDNEFGRSTTSI